MTECFRCGQEGHNRRECPQDATLPAVRAAGAEAPRARSKECDPENRAPHSNACRDGNRRGCTMDWCECRCHANQPRPAKDPEYLPVAEVLNYDPGNRCPEERVHEIAQEARDRLIGGKPSWLALRMKAWQQVAKSRRSRYSLPELEKPVEPEDAFSAAAPSPSGSSSGSCPEPDGLTQLASSNGHAP